MRSQPLEFASDPLPRSGLRRGMRSRWVRWGAAAAVLWLGIFITLSIWAEPGSPVAFHGERLVASGRLQQVIRDPSSADREGGPRVGKAFADKAGRDCRSFTQGAVDGTVCRIEGEWRVIEMRQR